MCKPKIQFVETGCHMLECTHPKASAGAKWGSLLRTLSVHWYRTNFLVEKITTELEAGRRIIVIADRLTLVGLLVEKFVNLGDEVAHLDGKVQLTERSKLHDRLRTGQVKLFIASPMIDPLIDLLPVVCFDSLHLVTPTSAKFRGRVNLINYMDPDVPAVVSYYVDENPLLKGIFRKHFNWVRNNLDECDLSIIEREDKP